jgi:hypothetical protein
MSSSAAEVFELWEKNFSENVASIDLIRTVKSPMQEIRLSTFWKARVLSGELSKYELCNALRAVAETTCSVVLAKALLECGADVDFTRSQKMTERTPLYMAATKTTAEAAELMKLLLLYGADPNISYKVRRSREHKSGEIRTPSMERGAQNISKWLGMTWDQLVKWAEEERRKRSINEPGS